jgi:hypothetical protein
MVAEASDAFLQVTATSGESFSVTSAPWFFPPPERWKS